MSRWRALWKCNLGTTAVEFSHIIGPLLMLMFSISEYGRLFWAQEALQEAATAGARCIGIRSSSCASGGAYSSSNATTFIQNEAQKWSLTVPSSGIVITTPTTCAGVSGFSQVALTYSFQSILPQLLNLTATGTTLTAISCFPAS